MSSGSNLWNLAAVDPDGLLRILRETPSLASSQDENGYAILHAAASYGHDSLVRTLVQEYHVDVNVTDNDGDTALFFAETRHMARVLVEELGADPQIRNKMGRTAADAILEADEFPDVVHYLHGPLPDDWDVWEDNPPRPPQNVSVNFGTMSEQEVGRDEEVDPEFKRRIDELASRENFHGEEGQKELRELVTDAVKGVNAETKQRPVRPRRE